MCGRIRLVPLNLDLLERVRDQILNEPDSYDQTQWSTMDELVDPVRRGRHNKVAVTCLTTACVAGWACSLAGDQMLVDTAHDYVATQRYYYTDRVLTPEGHITGISERAQALLGLDWHDAYWLFHWDRTRQEVLDMLDWHIAQAQNAELDALVEQCHPLHFQQPFGN